MIRRQELGLRHASKRRRRTEAEVIHVRTLAHAVKIMQIATGMRKAREWAEFIRFRDVTRGRWGRETGAHRIVVEAGVGRGLRTGSRRCI